VALAFAVAWGVIQSRRARTEVARLVVDLVRSPPSGGLRDALAELVGDPHLLVGYPLADSGPLVDASGRPMQPSPGQVSTTLVRNGSTVAVLAHAPGLLDNEQLVEEVTAAAGLALGNERLQAEVHARLHELRESRARIVTAGDAERKRLERDLHDGAQQRLVSLAMALRLAEARIQDDPEAAGQLVAAAREELAQSLDELRELARGIHPAMLDHGLEVALESLAMRSPFPVSLAVELEDRLPEPVETAAYFVASEALANVGKYAQASTVTIRVSRDNGLAVIEVADDGVGGADDTRGSGLRGLADRVEALGGSLEVLSPIGGGTVLTAEMPCGS
jgi:signal transduction histidine kinase